MVQIANGFLQMVQEYNYNEYPQKEPQKTSWKRVRNLSSLVSSLYLPRIIIVILQDNQGFKSQTDFCQG